MPLRVIYSFPSRLGLPGIGTTAWHQVHGLIRQGLAVTVFCGSCERPISGAQRVVETMKIAGVKIPYRLLGDDRTRNLHDRLVANSLRDIRSSADVVHCWPSGALHTLRMARRHGIATLLERPSSHTAHVYNVTAEESQRLGVSLDIGHYAAMNTKRLAREEAEFQMADYLLCPSDFAAETHRVRGYDIEAIKLHQYGFDQQVFSCANRSAASDGSFNMAFIGECFPLKGLHLALEAWVASGACEHGKFYICGRFVPEYREVLKDRLTHPNLIELGFVSDVSTVMQRCDVLVLPSLSEGSALVTYEARACGLVLMVSSSSGARCTHGYDGLVHTSGNVAELTEHMEMLARDRAYLEELRSNSLKGLSELTWDRAGARLKQIYEEIVGSSRQSAQCVEITNANSV